MNLEHLSPGQIGAAIVLLGAVISVMAGWVKWARPRWRRLTGTAIAIRDAILGRDEVHDSITGAKLAEALPGMGVRTALLEQQVSQQVVHLTELTKVVKTLADTQKRQQDHGARLDAHDSRFSVVEDRLTKVELAAAERIVGKVESIAAYRAIEEVAKTMPDIEGQVVEDSPDPESA